MFALCVVTVTVLIVVVVDCGTVLVVVAPPVHCHPLGQLGKH